LSDGAAAAVPASLVASTVAAATLIAAGQSAAVAAPATILMKGVLQTMFLAKLKLVAGVVTLAVALGATGLAYRAGFGPGSAHAAPPAARSDADLKAEIEALRRENELLRQSLQLALDKVRAQETEIRTAKEHEAQAKKQAAEAEKRAAFNLTAMGPYGFGENTFGRTYNTFPSQQYGTLGTLTPYHSFSTMRFADTFPVIVEPDRVKEVEAAYKKLREAGSDDAKCKAAKELEKAIQALKAKKQ
jgi:hypothetical protein